jgi:hypothetical protein
LRRLGIFLLSALIVALGLPTPGSAFAADPSIVVNWANSVDDDLGVLQVSVTSAQAVTHLKAHVLSSDTGEEVASTEDFVLNSGTAEDGVWRTKDTFKLEHLGTYAVTIDVTAADGTQVTADRVGGLSYYARTVFEPLTSDPAAVDYAHRDVTVHGRLMTRSPGTRELSPFAGATVWVDYMVYDRNDNPTDNGGAEAHTGADGRFSFTRTLTGKADFDAYYSYENEFPYYIGGISDTLTVGVKQAPVRVTAAATPDTVDAGGQITVSGQATWKSPTGWRPLAGAVLFLDAAPGTPEVTTDADGHYSATVVPYVSTDVVVRYEVQDPFMGDGASKPVKVTVVQPSAIRDFEAARGEEAGTVEVSGDLDFPGPESPGEATVDIQFSTDGTTWHREATLPADHHFSGTITADQPGYWRAHYPGATMFQPATSDAVHVDPR